MSSVPRVVRNDWSTVAAPDLAGWRPELQVSVIIPAYQNQATLDLTLASLSHQTYPSDLLEVVIVDDGSEPPLTLPPIRPERTHLVRVDNGGWGRANALAYGAAHSSGDILHWLDADMVVYPEHVAAQARWQHVLPYAVTLGYKRFVDPVLHGPWPGPEVVDETWRRGAAADLFGGYEGEPHTYVERYVTSTDQLRAADHLTFRIHVGATAALRRELYELAGRFDQKLRLGEDTEFGYRLAQAGAVFIPEPQARSWHLGLTHVMQAEDQITRYNRPFLADRIPYPRHWRKAGGPIWSVPLVEAVIYAADGPLEDVRAAVDSVLRGTETDVRVHLVGPWDTLDDSRVRVLNDPNLDLRLIAATYRGEPRVRLVTQAPGSVFPAPFRLELPLTHRLGRDSVRQLVDLAQTHQVGVIRVNPPDGGTGRPLFLWRTAALERARWVGADSEPALDVVTAVYGSRDVSAASVGITAPGATAARRSARGRLTPTTVEVEGLRSLARATVVVAWIAGRRSMAWARGRTRRR